MGEWRPESWERITPTCLYTCQSGTDSPQWQYMRDSSQRNADTQRYVCRAESGDLYHNVCLVGFVLS